MVKIESYKAGNISSDLTGQRSECRKAIRVGKNDKTNQNNEKDLLFIINCCSYRIMQPQ